MSTLIQIESNRRNAQHSTGPATVQGKAAVRLNAVKYGIHAESLLIPGEDPAEFQALVTELKATWHPQDFAERQSVDHLIANSWRLNRLINAETQIWAETMEKEGSTLGDALQRRAAILDRVGRMIARLQRSIQQTTRELDRLQALRAKSEAKAAKLAEAARPEVTERSQFPTARERELANWRKQIE